MSGMSQVNSNYSTAYFKQRAIEFALKLVANEHGSGNATELVAEAKIIEAFLKEDNDSK